MPSVRVETPCFPTESRERVKAALRNLFPDLQFERDDERIIGVTRSLERLRELLRNQRIRDTARGQLQAGRSGSRTRFSLNKQAATGGLVNFAAPSPLGSIDVEIEDDDLTAVIDHVAESTVKPRLRPSARNAGR
ncbi:MAG TPA: RNA-binding domain-containing protein [Thermoplasmata archaeon]